MTEYPITARKTLDPTQKRGLLGLGKQRRGTDELPRPHAHEVLVYRVDGRYVLDSDRLRADDDLVVSATHVSVVDTSRHRPVRVEFHIPSRDADKFAVYVTFVCSVTDPVAVVRGGVNAKTSLWGYLRSHHKIFELGLTYTLSEVNEVRGVVNAQITAYTTIKPPTVSGMTIALASVEVGTPEYLATLEDNRRNQHSQYVLAEEKQNYDRRREINQAKFDHVLAVTKEEHEEVLAARRQRRDQSLAVTQQEHDQFLAAEASEFARRELERNLELLGDSPRQALKAAHAAGQITTTELAQRLQELDDRDREIADRLAERDRESERLRLEWDREDRRDARAAAREDRLLSHEERLREAEHRRAEAQREREWAREDARRRLEVKVDFLRTLVSQGHGDTANFALDRAVAELVGIPSPDAATSSADSQPQLLDTADPQMDEASEQDQRAQVYEEDD